MGLEGIDLNLCGPPGFRVNAQMQLAIGFKTVLHSPSADELFLERLEEAKMRSADIAIVELGTAWGPRGTRQPTAWEWQLPNLTVEEEIHYYVHWVHAVAFPNRLVLWLTACGCAFGSIPDQRQLMKEMWQEVQSHYKDAAVLVDKCVPRRFLKSVFLLPVQEYLVRFLVPKTIVFAFFVKVLADAEYGFETGHGCKGPLLNALAQMLHATLLQLEEKLVAFAPLESIWR